MTVIEVMAELQMMIDRGVITGSEQFGYFAYAGYGDSYFEEGTTIGIECEDNENVVYID